MKSITQLENIDKPREKLIKKGANALKDYELLAILLGSGVQGKDVISLSNEIIKLFEDDFENLSLKKLVSSNGLDIPKD